MENALLKYRELLFKHKLYDWSAKYIGDSARFLGYCSYKEKTVTISQHFAENASDEEIIDLMLHEIAHALSYEFSFKFTGDRKDLGHGKVWKDFCRQIGAKPERLYHGEYKPNVKPKYLLVNKETGKVHKKYYRKPNYNTIGCIGHAWIKGKKEATKGKLAIIPA